MLSWSLQLIVALFWCVEALPYALTALLPIVLMPLLGVASAKLLAPAYMSDTIFLFIGTYILALGLQESGLHTRLALWLIQQGGSSPSRVLLGFMAATWFLAIWMSNTATSALMCPIADAVIRQLGVSAVGFIHQLHMFD